MDRDRENELVRNCKRGDRQAMEALVSEYERPVYNAAYRMLGDSDDAADVSQATFLKAFQNLQQFNPTFRFFSWIYRIAINESINLLKRRLRSVPMHDTVAAPGPKLEDMVDAQQVSSAVQVALMDLSDDHRSVIVLRYFTDCSYQHIAKILRIPEKTVKSRLFTARQKLRSALENRRILTP